MIAIRGVILFVTLAVWAVVGLFFWIPLLSRVTASFSVSILYLTMANGDPRSLGRMLDTAMTFYPRGFRLVAEAMVSSAIQDVPDSGRSSESTPGLSLPEVSISRLIQELLFSAGYWFVLTYLLGFLDLPSIGKIASNISGWF